MSNCSRIKMRRSSSVPPRVTSTMSAVCDQGKEMKKNRKEKFQQDLHGLCMKPKSNSDDSSKLSKQKWSSFNHKIDVFGEGFVRPDFMDPEEKTSVKAISHIPVYCPIEECREIMGVTAVLQHFLNDHKGNLSVQCKEIFSDKGAVVFFDPSTLEMGQICCLGVLAYGGNENDPGSLPAVTGLGVNNVYLPNEYANLKDHLTILIMGCRTTWAAMLKNKLFEEKAIQMNNPNSHMLVLWLTSIETSRPLYGTLTAFDRNMTMATSNTIEVRPLSESQNPSTFMAHDMQQLRLTQSEVDLYSEEGIENLYLEIMINGNE